MRVFKYLFLTAGFYTTGVVSYADEAYVPGHPEKLDYKNFADDFVFNYCVDCHDDTDARGDLNLLDIGPVDETNAAVWKAVWAQVAIQEMPPKKKNQPSVKERIQFTDWVVSELERVTKDKGGFHAHKDPSKGNFVDHQLLFQQVPEELKLEPTYSPKRIWRVTPLEYITRLNELINREPVFDPEKPGLRTHGDAVTTNHGGELKLYFGVDRILSWGGGVVAYGTSVKSVPAVLSTARKHGLENYADFSSVNSAEVSQILNKAQDILKYMAYGPESLITFPEQITNDVAVFWRAKPSGDQRGLASNIQYGEEMIRPKSPLYELLKEKQESYTDEELTKVIHHLFEMLTFRPASEKEADAYLGIVRDTVKELGQEEGLFMGLSAIFLDRDALFRTELTEGVAPEEDGRTMLQDWELGLALNHALSYIKPDAELRKAIVEGKMRTREDVKREVTRMLNDESIRKPRVLQFFRDYFDYDLASSICKDAASLRETGVARSSAILSKQMLKSTASTDRLIELILADDKEVLKNLLTTQQVVASPNDSVLFGKKNKEPKSREEGSSELLDKQIARDRKKSEELSAILENKDFIKEEMNAVHKVSDKVALFREFMDAKVAYRELFIKIAGKAKRFNPNVTQADFDGPEIFARTGYMSFGKGSLQPDRILTTAPEGQRLGILTHPSWLISHSDAMDNHAIHRGIWIRKKLLGGGIPDVPITVDAQLPDEPKTTLRSRMRVTREEYCWSCHEKMDPLGLPFEMYNHAGIYRETELGEPVDTSGEIIDSGDPELDGKVMNAIDMIHKLAESERVEQVFVRHAFRFWMGRNETLHDGPVLKDAYKAYRDSGGSMNALITSLVTSDAFLYRK